MSPISGATHRRRGFAGRWLPRRGSQLVVGLRSSLAFARDTLPAQANHARSPRRLGWLLMVVALCSWMIGCATLKPEPQRLDVTLEVDFGPAKRPAYRQSLQVDRGATPELLTAKAFAIEKGAVCCDPREIAAIDGVAADPATNRWWTVAVNGSKKVSPYKTRLKAGDVVRWEYREYEQ